jgi:competence protein ComEC
LPLVVVALVILIEMLTDGPHALHVLLERFRALPAGLFRREPLPRRPLIAVAAAVIAGSVVGPAVSGSVGTVSVTGIVCCWWLVAAAAVVGWWRLTRLGRDGRAAVVLLIAIGCSAAGWAVVRHRLFAADDLAWSLDESPLPVAIEGVVVESPRLLTPPSPDAFRSIGLEPSSECVISVRAVRHGGTWRRASGRAAVIVDGPAPPLVSGSRVRVLGRGVRPAPALNPGEFDFRERARLLRCLSIVRCHGRECVRLLAAAPWFSPLALVDRLQAGGIDVLREHLSAARAPLAAALLLGSRESLPSEESREFLVTGTIHILSISGLHVGILAFALLKALRACTLPRMWSLVIVAGCTGGYMLLVRAETPVVRATLLVWLSCLGAAVGRRSLALNGLAAAAIIVLAWHPPEVFRIGTQLSFLSTAVLVGAAAIVPSWRPGDDPIERLIERSRSPWERRMRRAGRQGLAVIITGAAIWAVTAPLVAAKFHVVSPVGLVLNPLIAPLVPLAMAWGFLCLACAPLSSSLAGLCGAACDATLATIEAIVGWAAAVPAAYAWVAGPHWWWVAGWYVLLVVMLLTLARERLTRIGTWGYACAAWVGVGLVGLAAAPLLCPRPLALEAIVASMGHGCGIVVRSPTGRVLVYDAGRLGAPGAARRGMAAVLWSAGLSRIDTLVISHADTDHFNAVPELLERFSVGEVVVSEAFLRSDSGAVREVLRRVYGRSVPLRVVGAGEEIPCDRLCRVRVLHQETGAPGREGVEGRDDNQTSIVLAVESAGRRLLLTGDLEGQSLTRFVEADPDTCDVMLAPHHGSGTSLPPALASATRPEWVIVSGVGGRRWGEVKRAYETARDDGRTSRVLKTGGAIGDRDGSGAIAVRLSADGMTVEQYRGGRWRAADAPLTPSRASTAMPPPPGGRS